MNPIDDIKVLASSGFALSTWWIEALDPVLKCAISVATFVYVAMRIRYLYKNKGE